MNHRWYTPDEKNRKIKIILLTIKFFSGVFLIPYFLIMFVCGIPMLYMELAVGQFTGRGPIGALAQICPLFKGKKKRKSGKFKMNNKRLCFVLGAGLASVVISFLMSTYYSVIIAYGIYYFFTSFKAKMPWDTCSNRWNTNNCWGAEQSAQNVTRFINSRTPSEEFYE